MDKVIYQGLFLSKESENRLTNYLIENNMRPLEIIIRNMHITFEFGPSYESLFPQEILGKEFSIKVVGLGIGDFSRDDEEEGTRTVLGFEVELPEMIKTYYKGQQTIHITHSLGIGGKPMDCGKINFDSIQVPFEIKGKMGFYMKSKKIEYK